MLEQPSFHQEDEPLFSKDEIELAVETDLQPHKEGQLFKKVPYEHDFEAEEKATELSPTGLAIQKSREQRLAEIRAKLANEFRDDDEREAQIKKELENEFRDDENEGVNDIEPEDPDSDMPQAA